jgi:tetratricopeptide (TPR) repeat protein
MKAYAELARAYEKANRLKEAKEALDGALGYFPEGADLYYERARITEKMKDYKNAILDYQAFSSSIQRTKRRKRRSRDCNRSRNSRKVRERRRRNNGYWPLGRAHARARGATPEVLAHGTKSCRGR